MRIHLVLTLPLLLATAGCAAFDPYRREGTWRPTGANEQNLAIMAVQPAERVRGAGATGASGATAAAAIDRLRADRVKSLPDTGLARIITVPSGSGN
jgi:hypothetical protein